MLDLPIVKIKNINEQLLKLFFFYLNQISFFNIGLFRMLLTNKFKKDFFFLLILPQNTKYNWCVQRYRFEWMRFFLPLNKLAAEEFIYFNEFNVQGFIKFSKNSFIRNCVFLKRSSGLLRLKFNLNSIFLYKIKYLKFNENLLSKYKLNEYFTKKYRRNRFNKFSFLMDNNLQNTAGFNNSIFEKNTIDTDLNTTNLDTNISCVKTQTLSKKSIRSIIKKLKFKNKLKNKKKMVKLAIFNNKLKRGVMDNENISSNLSEKIDFNLNSFKTTALTILKQRRQRKRKKFYRRRRRKKLYRFKLNFFKNIPFLRNYLNFKLKNIKYDTTHDYNNNFFFNDPLYVNKDDFFYTGWIKRKRAKYFRYTTKSKYNPDSPKNLFQRRFKATIYKNRKIISLILQKKMKAHRRHTHLSKFLKNFIKKPFKDFFYFFELSLSSVLLRSHFFFGVADLEFFIKNNFIYVNNKVVTNKLKILNEFDKINFVFNKSYYYYYRCITALLKTDFQKLSDYTFMHKKIEYDYTKTTKPDYPNWFKRFVYLKKDIPNFLEVDFITMTIIIIYKPKYMFEFNKNIIRFVNHYQRHLYNWRFII